MRKRSAPKKISSNVVNGTSMNNDSNEIEMSNDSGKISNVEQEEETLQNQEQINNISCTSADADTRETGNGAKVNAIQIIADAVVNVSAAVGRQGPADVNVTAVKESRGVFSRSLSPELQGTDAQSGRRERGEEEEEDEEEMTTWPNDQSESSIRHAAVGGKAYGARGSGSSSPQSADKGNYCRLPLLLASTSRSRLEARNDGVTMTDTSSTVGERLDDCIKQLLMQSSVPSREGNGDDVSNRVTHCSWPEDSNSSSKSGRTPSLLQLMQSSLGAPRAMSVDSDVTSADVTTSLECDHDDNNSVMANETTDGRAAGLRVAAAQIDPNVLEVVCGGNTALFYPSRWEYGGRGACVSYDGRWLTPNEFQLLSGRRSAKDWKRSIKHRGTSLKALLSSRRLQLEPPAPCRCHPCIIERGEHELDSSCSSLLPVQKQKSGPVREKKKKLSAKQKRLQQQGYAGEDVISAVTVSASVGDSYQEEENWCTAAVSQDMSQGTPQGQGRLKLKIVRSPPNAVLKPLQGSGYDNLRRSLLGIDDVILGEETKNLPALAVTKQKQDRHVGVIKVASRKRPHCEPDGVGAGRGLEQIGSSSHKRQAVFASANENDDVRMDTSLSGEFDEDGTPYNGFDGRGGFVSGSLSSDWLQRLYVGDGSDQLESQSASRLINNGDSSNVAFIKDNSGVVPKGSSSAKSTNSKLNVDAGLASMSDDEAGEKQNSRLIGIINELRNYKTQLIRNIEHTKKWNNRRNKTMAAKVADRVSLPLSQNEGEVKVIKPTSSNSIGERPLAVNNLSQSSSSIRLSNTKYQQSYSDSLPHPHPQMLNSSFSARHREQHPQSLLRSMFQPPAETGSKTGFLLKQTTTGDVCLKQRPKTPTRRAGVSVPIATVSPTSRSSFESLLRTPTAGRPHRDLNQGQGQMDAEFVCKPQPKVTGKLWQPPSLTLPSSLLTAANLSHSAPPPAYKHFPLRSQPAFHTHHSHSQAVAEHGKLKASLSPSWQRDSNDDDTCVALDLSCRSSEKDVTCNSSPCRPGDVTSHLSPMQAEKAWNLADAAVPMNLSKNTTSLSV